MDLRHLTDKNRLEIDGIILKFFSIIESNLILKDKTNDIKMYGYLVKLKDKGGNLYSLYLDNKGEPYKCMKDGGSELHLIDVKVY